MKTILITGEGIGKGVTISQLRHGRRVIVVSRSKESGNAFMKDAKEAGSAENAFIFRQI